MLCLFCNDRNCLDRRRPCSYYTHSFLTEFWIFFWPFSSMIDSTFENFLSYKVRHVRRGKATCSHNAELAVISLSIGINSPSARALVVFGRHNPSIKQHVAAKFISLYYMLNVFQRASHSYQMCVSFTLLMTLFISVWPQQMISFK